MSKSSSLEDKEPYWNDEIEYKNMLREERQALEYPSKEEEVPLIICLTIVIVFPILIVISFFILFMFGVLH